METVLRVLFVYVFLIFALRVMGKREFSDFTPMELVTLLLIPELLQQALIGNDPSLVNSLIAASTLLSLVFLNSVLTYRSRRLEKMVESTPSVLAFEGQLVRRNLRLERISPDELMAAIQLQGYDQLNQVKWAILQGNGKIAVVPTEAAR